VIAFVVGVADGFGVRYGDGGGVDEAGRSRREQVRLQAAGMFADGISAPEVA
jgi:putative transposase